MVNINAEGRGSTAAREQEEKASATTSKPSPPLKISNTSVKGARTQFFSQAWQQVTSNSFVLNIIFHGYKIQFTSLPIQSSFSPKSMSQSVTDICRVKVKEYLKYKIIRKVKPSQGQYLSDIFPVAKKSLTDHRIIIDLSDLNLLIRKVHFKMDCIPDIMALIRPGDWFVSIHLSDAYFCIAMHLLSMPYLTFVFLHVFYQFTCLPQGFCESPRIFTKVVRVVLTYLRSRGIRIAAWIDDFILASSSRSLSQEHAFFAVRTFEELGFLPNVDKSRLAPTQKICHLGLVWDSVQYSVSIPLDKIVGVRSKCLVALSFSVTVRFLSSILGSVEYFKWGFPFAALHYRRLQRYVNSCLNRGLSYDSYVVPSSAACIDLRWWSSVGDSLPFRSLSPFVATQELYCDASLTGWGSWTSEGKEAFGAWSDKEAELHINVLEGLAVLFAFKCFYKSTYNSSILVRSDNTSVVAYINKQGGTGCSRLCDIALEIWEFCVSRNISISASHLSGVANVRADKLSRLEHSDHSYFLSQEVFDEIADSLDFSLDVDCFASRLNFKLPKFVSHYYDPLSFWVNAFSLGWSDNVYLFPPIPIIQRVLDKFIADGTGRGLLICPYWPSQSWYPTLLSLLIAPPILLPAGSIVDKACRLPRHCRQVAWTIGSSPAARKGYQGTLQYVGSRGLVVRPSLLTSDAGQNSVVGLINGCLVTVVSL